MSEQGEDRSAAREGEKGLKVCPYCGHVAAHEKECEQCKGLFEPLSRQASQNAMGPWYIRDEQSPFRPGCSYQTLKMLVQRSRVTRETVLRGPSTRQFWMRAGSVPGVAHLLGECHACHKETRADDRACGHCGASFGVEEDRQYLGLAEVRSLPGQASAGAIARQARSAARPVQAREPAVEVETRDGGVQVEDLSTQGVVEFPREYEPRATGQWDGAGQGGPRGAKRNQSLVLGLIVASILAAIVVLGVVIVLAVQGLRSGAAPAPTGATKVAPSP